MILNNSKSPVNTYLESILAQIKDELDKTGWTATEEQISNIKLIYAEPESLTDEFVILFGRVFKDRENCFNDRLKIKVPMNTQSPILIEQARLAIIGWSTTLVEQFNARVDRGMVELEISVLETRLAQEQKKLEVANEKLEECTNPTNLVEKGIESHSQNLEKGNQHD